MNSESRRWATVGMSALALVMIGVFTGLSGCNPHRDQLRPENLFEPIGRRAASSSNPESAFCAWRSWIVPSATHQSTRSLEDSR